MSGSKWLAGLVIALAIFAIYSSSVGPKPFDLLFQDGLSRLLCVYVVGCISGILFVPMLAFALKKASGYLFLSKEEGIHELYRLDHGILNVEVPPPTMWMNMGYWKQTSNFPVACRALLEEVLITARLLGRDMMPSDQLADTRLTVIDLGFGCGDQTIYLAQLPRKTPQKQTRDSAAEENHLFDTYIGLTIASSQFAFASQRLYSDAELDRARVKLFCADAAKPVSWSEEIYEAVANTSTEKGSKNTASARFMRNTWILALDTLYHFKPSREAIFRHAFGELDASIMAFDLFLSDTPSLLDLILLRIVCLFAESPFSNFLTTAQYKNQLRTAGYDESNIEIRDISDHVFPGIASFIKRRDGQLKKIGMNIGRYSVAGKMFGWWARSGIIRGCIVVARR